MTEIIVPDYDAMVITGLTPNFPSQVNRSAWTGRRKVVGLPGAESWTASLTVPDIATEIEERKWRAFLIGLKGPQNWFRWYLPCNRHYGPKPRVNAASADGYSLPLDGMAVSTRILSAGQFMTVPLPSGHSRLICLAQDLVTNSSGEATAAFGPALHEVPADNAEVETGNPWIPLALTSPNVGISYSDSVAGLQLDVEEAL
ncbi:MAG: hypothetical protein ACK4ZW_08600 [Blastomonas sp.]